MRPKKKPPFHPLLISIYPPLALIAFNLGEFDLMDGWRPVAFSLVLGAIVWLIFQLVMRNKEKSALLASLTMMFFLGYGHAYNLIRGITVGGFLIGRHRFLLAGMGIFLVLGFLWVLRWLKDTTQVTQVFNIVSLVLLVFPVIQIVTFQVNAVTLAREGEGVGAGLDIEVGEVTTKPDIYFIILDAYGREDTLETLYGYDNSGFVEDLESLGFYVADCSQSNYPETYLSLISALNMEYEQASWGLGKTTDREKYFSFIRDNALRTFLTEQGYITVAVESNVYWTEWKEADVYLSFKDPQDTRLNLLSKLDVINDFETQFLDTTIVLALNGLDMLSSSINPYTNGYQKKYDLIHFQLEQLEEMANIPGPKFVFVHISTPHRPFIIGPAGEAITDPKVVKALEADYRTGYTNQVTYINSRMLPILEAIIQNSAIPPVIILMGDHGPDFTEPEYRATNLSAYYFPGGEDLLYASITPVNSFRLVLNHYFGTGLPLLEDVHFFIPKDHKKLDPSEYQAIPNVGEACE